MSRTTSALTRLAALVLALAAAHTATAAAAPLDLDPSFGSGGVVRSAAGQGGRWSALRVLPDGRFLVAGQVAPDKAAVARYTAAGTLDTSFAADQPVPGVLTFGGPGGTTVPADLVVLPDGHILVGATASTGAGTATAMLVERLTADGHVDTGFGSGGGRKVNCSPGCSLGGIALQSTGAIVLAGRSASGTDAGVVARLSATGATDGAFAGSGQAILTLGANPTRFDDVAVDSSDRILLTGSRATDAGRRQLTVARLTATGASDTTYGVHDAEYVVADLNGAGASGNDVEGRRISLDAGGRPLVAATVQSTTAGGPHLIGLARFTPAGALDGTFGTAGTATQDVSPSHVADLADLTALDGGGFAVAGRATVGSTGQFVVAGYHADGSPDASLNPGHGATSNAATIAAGDGGADAAGAVGLLPSGRLLIAGTTVDAAGDTGAIARLGGGNGQAPIAAFSTSYPHAVDGRPVRPGQTVSFDAGASSDPDGSVASYAWDLDGDGQTDHTGAKVSMTYSQAGKVAVLLRVTDDKGLVGTTGGAVDVVADAAPGVAITKPAKAQAGKPYTVSAFAADADGTIAKYAWDLDANGTYETDTGNANHVSVTRDAAGPAKIAVQVTDDEGATGSATDAIDVQEGPCIDNPVIRAAKAVIVTQSAASADGCFHASSTLKDGVRTTTYTTYGHFRVNGIEVDTVNGSKAELTYKREVTTKAGKETDGKVLQLHLYGPRTKVTGMSAGTDFAFHDGGVSWDLDGDTIKGFHVDANAGIGGLPLKVPGEPKLDADGSSTLDITPGAPAELLGKTSTKPTHAKFGPTAAIANDGAFSFQVDTIPLGVVTLGPVTISYDGAGRWDISAEASMAVPVPASLKGHLALVNGKVKSVSLKLTGAITAGPILITEIGVSIDFGPKVDADPDCIKHVGIEDQTPYSFYDFLDKQFPGYRQHILAEKPQTSPLFHQILRDYHTPNFALCGSVGLSVAEVVDANVSFGFARYADPLPNLFAFHGQGTIVKVINATLDAQITTDGYVHVNAAVSGGYPSKDPWIGWNLGLDFEYFKKKFNAEAYARINIIPLDFKATAQLVASNKGIAACLTLGTPFGDWKPGGGAMWGHGPKLYLFGCDVNDYKVVINNPLAGDVIIGPPAAPLGTASAARAGGLPVARTMPTQGRGNEAVLLRVPGTRSRTARRGRIKAAAAQAPAQAITVPSGLPGTVMAFKGAGAAPHLIIHGPKGETIDTGAGQTPVETPGVVALKDETTGITQVAIAKPSGGRWTVDVTPDSSRLVQAIQADGVVETTVTTKVTGSEQNRRLTYHVSDLRPGEHLDLVEVGAAAGSMIGRVDADGDGTLPFHPGEGPAGKRQVQAVVTAPDGFVRDRIVAGSYVAPSAPRPAKVAGLKLKAAGRTLTLSWPKDRTAKTFQVDVRSSTGLNFTKIVKRSSVKIPAPPAKTRLTVTIKGTSKTGIGGRPATYKRTVPKAKAKAKKRVKKH